jgi:hypothetical protein
MCHRNCIFARLLGKGQFLSLSLVLSNTCNVLFSCVCVLIEKVFICRYIFMPICSFTPGFREAAFCGVPSFSLTNRCMSRVKTFCGTMN